MQRREFLAASAAAATLGFMGAGHASAAVDAAGGRQLYEVRIYHFASEEKQKAFSKFLAEAAVPALNRAGVSPVGVFALHAKDNAPLKLTSDPLDLVVILPHKDFESLATLSTKLMHDEAMKQAGQAILTAPKSDPAYTRYESSLLWAYEMAPTLQVPTKAPTRILQLRTYESHSLERAMKKLEMFQQGGELEIFKRVGMTGVFFGQCLAGSKMPSLTYALMFDDEAALKKAWDGFQKHPAWQKLKGDDTYKDTVSTITNWILRPEAGSQV